ncbi:MAG TPA: 2-oxoacid:acceptor oxidoreductase family protein [bacterium]|jgi:2-oxoglutarate ferredoxin oxidoreductase subunit gamma|nr:2-oxoacid:acceptor oxidoreductase family protein [bacterium]MDX9805728.1 2-oxoacid:acceptor oxidoreductase family protein [bacterium]HOG43373.1 2-oxoacid:acceptor oxidoreductase family protein [bacterium]HPG36786.1 2-oxoacid:acceptor oxidoreductase family protein [bacterium]HPM46101.1 2-oxoacid:acceptor oxidoreductase family protein [bacterium]
MKYEVRFSGSGGQGVILASVILGTAAALFEKKHAVQSQAYGPEARGGASKADVVISDNPVKYPKAREIDAMVCLTQKAANKYISTMKKGGVVILDSDYVDLPECENYKLIKLPMSSKTLEKQGKLIALNVVSLSALVGITKIVSFESLEKAVLESAPKGTEKFNLEAVAIGRELAQNSGN